MKNVSLLITSIILICLTTSGCIKDSCERTVNYIKVTPIYKTVEEIREGTIVNEAPRDLEQPGKIYFLNNYLFINELREGVHVIDNSNPSNPQNIGFISIPGNEDIAIKDGILYANSYIDLFAIDVSDIQNAQLIGREESVFPPIWEDLDNNQILVYYDEEEVTESMSCQEQGSLWQFGSFWFGCPSCAANIDFTTTMADVAESSTIGGGTGIGGSMARFSIVGDYLYTVDNTEMDIFSLSNPVSPELTNTVNLGWGIETIFPYQDMLFIGSNTGMFIYDNANPEAPSLLSEFQHARACDPVFVKDNYAYVTLRDGTQCEGFNNQLDLIDITEITNPQLEGSFPMDNPHGLSIKDNNLFVCEGRFGLKAFDISEPNTFDQRLTDHLNGIFAYDVIAVPGSENVLLVIGEDGFFQYNFDDPNNLRLLSSILVSK